MNLKTKTWLYDIYKSIEGVEGFIGIDMNYEYFSTDLKTRMAVERSLEIIGEASNRILKTDEATAEQISDIGEIIDTRNRISHGYESVSYKVLWNIIQNDLPILKKKVSELLKN